MCFYFINTAVFFGLSFLCVRVCMIVLGVYCERAGFFVGSRPTPRPIVIATPPPAVSNVAVPPSPSQQQESAVTDMMESLSLKQQPPIENAAVRPQKPSAPAAPSNGNGGRKSVGEFENFRRGGGKRRF